jgi:peptide/nickel transport system permease protein
MPISPVDVMISRILGPESSQLGGQRGYSGGGAQMSLEDIRKLYMGIFGLDQPVTTQYLLFWKRIITLDFGLSFWAFPHSVREIVSYALPWTLVLVLPTIPIAFIIGNSIGSRAAFYRSKFDNLLFYVAQYMWHSPYFWFGLILVTIFSVELGWFPISGAYSRNWLMPVLSIGWLLDAVWHWVLPFLSLICVGIGGWAVSMRSLVIYEMESNYVEYAEQLGFSKKKLRNYVMKNSILPNFTWIPVVISSLISQTLLVEVIFGYPGLGTLAYNAVFSQDYPLIEAILVLCTLIVLIGNFICDIMYGIFDPRIGSSYVGGK